MTDEIEAGNDEKINYNMSNPPSKPSTASKDRLRSLSKTSNPLLSRPSTTHYHKRDTSHFSQSSLNKEQNNPYGAFFKGQQQKKMRIKKDLKQLREQRGGKAIDFSQAHYQEKLLPVSVTEANSTLRRQRTENDSGDYYRVQSSLYAMQSPRDEEESSQISHPEETSKFLFTGAQQNKSRNQSSSNLLLSNFKRQFVTEATAHRQRRLERLVQKQDQTETYTQKTTTVLAEQEDEESQVDSVKTKDTRYMVQQLLKVQSRLASRTEELEKRIARDSHRLNKQEDFELVTTKYVMVEHMKGVREN
ncbi:hypothetical protein FGO68_gene10394 [Halteria grandinella]|uniref:Uncharacterized protein n=1 Tax=Halteria grandinella TaxID=5974 RepID=A0A8J8P2F9_HALGN|nr:hypothetical protein FGO68_gene10394 [Halteria grandinella]